jgi:hypothetical protein
VAFTSDAVRHVFSVAESEKDPVRRADELTRMAVLFSDEMRDAVARCYMDLNAEGYRHRDIVPMFGFLDKPLRSWVRDYCRRFGLPIRLRIEPDEPDEMDVIDMTGIMNRNRLARLRRSL